MLQTQAFSRRRALVAGGNAAVAAVAGVVPTVAAASVDHQLIEFFETWKGLVEKAYALQREFGEASDRAKAEYPPIPREIRSESKRPFALSEEALRNRYGWPGACGQLARAIGAERDWRAQVQSIDARHSVAALDKVCEATVEAQLAVEDRMRPLAPASPAGIVAKLVVAAMRDFDEDPPQIGTHKDDLRQELAAAMVAVGLSAWPWFADDPDWLADPYGQRARNAA